MIDTIVVKMSSAYNCNGVGLSFGRATNCVTTCVQIDWLVMVPLTGRTEAADCNCNVCLKWSCEWTTGKLSSIHLYNGGGEERGT